MWRFVHMPRLRAAVPSDSILRWRSGLATPAPTIERFSAYVWNRRDHLPGRLAGHRPRDDRDASVDEASRARTRPATPCSGRPSKTVVMRYKLADANDARDYEFAERLERNRAEVESRLRQLGATRASGRGGDRLRPPRHHRVRRRPQDSWPTTSRTCPTARCCRWATRSRSSRTWATPRRSASSTTWTTSAAPTPSATCGWRPSPTSTSPAPIPTGRTRSPTWPSSTTAS